MYRITRQIHFCYGHRLLEYAGKCRHLHGHNGRVVIALEANSLDSLGMVMDFSKIKDTIKSWIDQNLDHRMLLHENDPLLPFLRQQGEPVYIMPVNPTAENIARLIYDFAASQAFPVVEVELWETDHCCASYAGTEGGVRDKG